MNWVTKVAPLDEVLELFGFTRPVAGEPNAPQTVWVPFSPIQYFGLS